MAECVDHGDDNEGKGEGNPDVAYGALAVRIHHRCARPIRTKKNVPRASAATPRPIAPVAVRIVILTAMARREPPSPRWPASGPAAPIS